MFKREVSYYKSFSTTFQSKAIISKSILLSKLSYICNVHIMPNTIKNAINKILFKFFVPVISSNVSEQEIHQKLIFLAAPKFRGGYLLFNKSQ